MKCEICGEEISGGSAFTCNYCGGVFCPKHRLPFNHACKNLAEWKKSGLPGKKGTKRTGTGKASAMIPFYQKKEVLIGGIIIAALVIVIMLIFLKI